MPQGKLSALQQQILVVLSQIRPIWTLTGGAALAGFHTKHRETRDLDLFFHHQQELGSIVVDATQALRGAGLGVVPVRSSAMFAQLDVRLDAEEFLALERELAPHALPGRGATRHADGVALERDERDGLDGLDRVQVLLR